VPENRNNPAGNWVGSGNHKAGSLLVSSVPAGPDIALEARRSESDLTFEDRHSAWLAGFDLGCAQRVEVEIEDQVQARLHTRTLEALGMAKRYAAAKGPAWSAMVLEAGERE